MKKEWPNYYPSGKKVPFNVKMKYYKELKAGKKSRSHTRPKRKGQVGGRTMARKKTRIVYRTKKAIRRSRKTGGQMNIQKLAMPIVFASIAEPFVDNVAGQLPIPTIMGVQPDDAVKVALAWYFKNKGGIGGNTVKMMGIFGLRNIVKQLMGNVMGGGVQQTDVFASQGFR